MLPVAVGIVILVVLANIPIIGGPVKFLALILGLGAITTAIFSKKEKKKKK